jgi:hypothetical protein
LITEWQLWQACGRVNSATFSRMVMSAEKSLSLKA